MNLGIMQLTNLTGTELRQQIATVRLAYQQKQISRDEAKAQAEPIIAEMERRGAEIAKKYNKKAPKFSFIGLMR